MAPHRGIPRYSGASPNHQVGDITQPHDEILFGVGDITRCVRGEDVRIALKCKYFNNL